MWPGTGTAVVWAALSSAAAPSAVQEKDRPQAAQEVQEVPNAEQLPRSQCFTLLIHLPEKLGRDPTGAVLLGV